MSKYDDLVRKLKEIFQIDRPELDFGVYRILNARSSEVNDYLEHGLKNKVVQSLAESGAENLEALQKELTEKISQYKSDGMNPDDVPKVKELKKKIADLNSGGVEHENAIFTHLLTFFSRYYDKGDFISQRRFKGDTYAIPYGGEEVVLHWANKEQYYTKSGENFSNYGFKLDDGRSVKFKLVAADTAKDNRKDNDKDRLFVLVDSQTRILKDEFGEEYEITVQPIDETDGELTINFDYKAMAKGTKQDSLVLKAVDALLSNPTIQSRWLELGRREPTEKNPQRTLLEKCLTSYTTKNQADYFIHKNLGHFLRRELDFYIKNEVVNLDDIQSIESISSIDKTLALVRNLRVIASDLITFLAQLEDFQKKLWLKKKFVVSTQYCITLDRVPESLYPIIASNASQWTQWKELGLLSEVDNELFNNAKQGTAEYLKNHQFLMVDTALFESSFKSSLLASIHNLDEELDGLLIHSDNFQALNLLQEKYKEQIKSVYIDPPYNTDASEIIYKNGFKNSSWASMLMDRLELSKNLMRNDGVLCATIDDFEFLRLRYLIESCFGKDSMLGVAVIKNNPSGRSTAKGFSIAHEYGIFVGKTEDVSVGRLNHSEQQISRYKFSDEGGAFEWVNFRKHGGANANRYARRKLFYPIFISETTGVRFPQMEWNSTTEEWNLLEQPIGDESITYPVNPDGEEKTWKWGHESARAALSEFSVRLDQTGKPGVYKKARLNIEGTLPLTVWDKKEYSSTEYGTNYLKRLFGASEMFSFPKSIHAVEDSLRVCQADSDAIVLDYFGGSGTTADATIALNRSDSGSRKFILIEQGDYFDKVTKPRIQKVVFSPEWKDGKPLNSELGVSCGFKVIKLESYEDTLNNLALSRSTTQESLLKSMSKEAQQDYLLRYLLDVESRGSLLSVTDFKNPFDFKLKLSIDSAGAFEERHVDLVETFNYLIGLNVKHIDMKLEMGFATVSGKLPNGEKALIVWRDSEQVDYEKLNRLCEKLAINPADSEFDVVYINGDHNIPTVFSSTESEGGVTKTLKIRQIESEFMTRMFSMDA
ncbi:site-specific DNA-methyltransferase [Limnohabitans sp. Jir61]|uniref:site-specific DNA-methyltransferase n=1 Tax=Limnohabitans sp. Jir61 TaxID=1826168 RepID=UPI000D3C2951|nr:DNA methyltransferase [Limnohabitans sp. Jir61]PUE28048.1 site-specific DNA-methyltransferase [Limnohabitans sp. Jir61]